MIRTIDYFLIGFLILWGIVWLIVRILKRKVKKDNKAIVIEAQRIYESGGKYSVFDYAVSQGITDFEYCGPCEIMSPQIDHSCLVCGSPTLKKYIK